MGCEVNIYLAMFNPCIYESAYGVISLHATRQGAQRAISENKRSYEKDMQRKAKYWEKWKVMKMDVAE